MEVAGYLIIYKSRYEGSSIALLAKRIDIYHSEDRMKEGISTNEVYLEGYIDKKPLLSITQTGEIIANLFIAIERDYGGWDYVNCVTWNKAVMYVSTLEKEDFLQMCGRLLSWHNTISLNEDKRRSDYEVSIRNVHKK